MIGAPEFKRNRYNHEYTSDIGFAMVRPDGSSLHLDEVIINRVEPEKLHIVQRKLLKLGDMQVDSIYGNLKDRSFYAGLKSSLVGSYVMDLVVGGDCAVSKRLVDIKGSVWDYEGVRPR